MIQTPETNKAAKLTTPTCCLKLWSQSPIHSKRLQSPPLDKEDTKYIQAVAGTLLHNGRAVDNTILTSLSAVATKQAKPMQKMNCATQEDAIISYRASKMILAIHSDTGYCNKKQSRIRAGGHFFLLDDVDNPPTTAPYSHSQQLLKQ